MSRAIPIIIYQMGKVGSTAIHNALSPTIKNVFQVHSLVPKKLDKTSRILTDNGLGIPQHVLDSQFVIENYLQKRLPVKIITPVRSPLQRNMSSFFQELSTEVILKEDLRLSLGVHSLIKQIRLIPIPNEWKNLLIQKAIQPKLVKHINLLINYFKSSYRHRIPLDWFEVEFEEAVGLDVFNLPFDQEAGYQTYTHENFEMLIFRSELANDIKSKIISEFINESVSIESKHKSDTKSYGQAYQLFKENILLDDEFLSPYVNSKYTDKFYSGI